MSLVLSIIKSFCKVGSYCDLCMVMFLMFDSVTVNHKSLCSLSWWVKDNIILILGIWSKGRIPPLKGLENKTLFTEDIASYMYCRKQNDDYYSLMRWKLRTPCSIVHRLKPASCWNCNPCSCGSFTLYSTGRSGKAQIAAQKPLVANSLALILMDKSFACS